MSNRDDFFDDGFILPDLDIEDECTCTNCQDVDDCAFAFSPENVNGICIAEEEM